MVRDGDSELVLVGVELVGPGHGYADGRERVQDADGGGMRCEHLGEALVAVRGLVEASAAEDDVGALHPLVHHLGLDEAFAFADTGLAVEYGRSVSACVRPAVFGHGCNDRLLGTFIPKVIDSQTSLTITSVPAILDVPINLMPAGLPLYFICVIAAVSICNSWFNNAISQCAVSIRNLRNA